MKTKLKQKALASLLIALCLSAQSDEIDTRVENEARAFRIRVYNLFRADRPQYDQLIAGGESVLHSVRSGKMSAEQAIAWFRSNGRLGTKADPPKRLDRVRPSPRPIVMSETVPHQPIKTDDAVSPFETNDPVLPSDERRHDKPPKASGVVSRDERADNTETMRTETISSTTNEVSAAPVSIDLNALSARIESTNLVLETIEGQLNRDSARLFPDELRDLVNDLEDVLLRQDLSTTYLNLLSEQEKRHVAPMTSADEVIRLLVRRLFEAQIIAHERFSVSGSADHKNTLNLLQELTKKVRKWQSR